MINQTKIKVRYVETDQMGIVHHSNYYAWFEVGRTELLAQTGMAYGKMEEQAILFPLVESSCKYIYPARYEDIVVIETTIESFTGAKISFGYKIIREVDQKLLSTGRTIHAITNKSMQLVNLKKVNVEIWKLIKNMIESKI